MSATPNHAGAGWAGPLAGVSDLRAHVPDESGTGRDALQALLAFACIHEQAARHRQLRDSGDSAATSTAEQFGLDEVLRLVAARARSITGADGVAIALAEENAIVCRASVGSIAPDPGVRLDPNSGFSGACLLSGQPVRCDDSETDERVNARACRTLGARSLLAVPLSAKQRIVGLIEAFSTETYGFNDSDVRSLNLLGELILAAIRPEEEDRLAELAIQVVPQPAPEELRKPEERTSAPALPVAPAKIIIDEKFAPAPAHQDATEAESVSEVVAAEETLPEAEKPIASKVDAPALKEGPSVSNLWLTAALVIVVIGLGWAVLWKARHVGQSISANTQPLTAGKIARAELQAANAPATVEAPGATPQVTGIRHWSSAESSTVVVDLEDQVQYEAHSLDNPARIYFDLHDTKMAPGLLNHSIVVNDSFLKRVRMAQPVEGVTRVVLETRVESEFSVKLDSNPYRLTIEVHKQGANTIPRTLSKPSPVIESSPKKGKPSSESRLNTAEFRIVLDAGHGGWDLGTVGRKGLLEKDLVLDIVQ